MNNIPPLFTDAQISEMSNTFLLVTIIICVACIICTYMNRFAECTMKEMEYEKDEDEV